MSDFERGTYWAMALASTVALWVIAIELVSICGG